MDPGIKRQWTGALRSGKYPQGRFKLAITKNGIVTGWCCLGVLCDLAVKAGVIPEPDAISISIGDRALAFGSLGNVDLLPWEVLQWAGLDVSDPEVIRLAEDDAATLSELNDEGIRFSDIADLIDAQL